MSLRPNPTPGKPYLTQGLIVAWRGPYVKGQTEFFPEFYELLIQEVIPDAEIFTTTDGKDILIPKCRTLMKTKITKGNAKILMDYGLKPGGAYFVEKKEKRKRT